jgi:hypothetical protein
MPEKRQADAPAGIREDKEGMSAGVLAGLVFMAAVLAGLYFMVQRQSQPEAPPAPNPEAEEYLENLAVADLRMSAEENFLQQQVTYLDGRLSNQGDRTIQQLRLRLYFRDTLNQVVLRVDRDVIGSASAPLTAGESREFRLQFDNVPASWNRQVPQFQLVSMEFQ